MAKPIKKPTVHIVSNESGHPVLEVTRHPDFEKTTEFKDIRNRPDFTYEKLCYLVGVESADFIFKDVEGNLLFEIGEDIVVNGQTRKNYIWKQFQSMKSLEEHSMYKEEESAKGTIKSFKTHAITAFINYNFHKNQTSASAQLIKLVNRWLKQFHDDLKVIKDVSGLDLSDWFEISGESSEQKMGSLYYLNYPKEHPRHKQENKHVQLGVLKDPNGWTNLTPKFGLEGMYIYHANEEPVRVRTSIKDKSEILDHQLVEVNEGILLNNIYRSAVDSSHPYIVHSTFNANTTKNIRVQRNTNLFPHPTEWMLQNPRENHTMIKNFPDEKKGLGIAIMRQSKVSSPALRNPDKNGNTFALDGLVKRIVEDKLEQQEMLTVLGIPFDMPDPNLSTTYVNLEPNKINFEEFMEMIQQEDRVIHRVDAGIDQDPTKEFCFHISCSVWNDKAAEWEIFRIANMNSGDTTNYKNKVLAAKARTEWVIEEVRKFIKFKIKSEIGNIPKIFIDDHMFSLLVNLENDQEISDLQDYGEVEIIRAPKINGFHKDDRNPNNAKQKVYYHGSIENRVHFENQPHIYPNIYFIEEFNHELLEQRKEIQSYFDEKKNLWLRIEDHNRQPLNRVNAMEYAESQIREDLSWSKIRYKKKRVTDSEGNIKYEHIR